MIYSLEYFFIPSVVEKSNLDEFDEGGAIVLDAMDSFKLAFSLEFPEQARQFNWDDLCIIKKMTTKYEYWFLQFPLPEVEPNALWGMVVHYNDRPYQYFTFELTSKGNYALCSMTPMGHINYGIYDSDTKPDKFVELVMKLAAPK